MDRANNPNYQTPKKCTSSTLVKPYPAPPKKPKPRDQVPINTTKPQCAKVLFPLQT